MTPHLSNVGHSLFWNDAPAFFIPSCGEGVSATFFCTIAHHSNHQSFCPHHIHMPCFGAIIWRIYPNTSGICLNDHTSNTCALRMTLHTIHSKLQSSHFIADLCCSTRLCMNNSHAFIYILPQSYQLQWSFPILSCPPIQIPHVGQHDGTIKRPALAQWQRPRFNLDLRRSVYVEVANSSCACLGFLQYPPTSSRCTDCHCKLALDVDEWVESGERWWEVWIIVNVWLMVSVYPLGQRTSLHTDPVSESIPSLLCLQRLCNYSDNLLYNYTVLYTFYNVLYLYSNQMFPFYRARRRRIIE